MPKTHVPDVVCVGETGTVIGCRIPTTALEATCRGAYARSLPDENGFERLRRERRTSVFGFATGDIVVADVPAGKKAGRHSGRAAVRATGRSDVSTAHGVVQGVSHRHCRIVQRGNGSASYVIPSTPPETQERRAFLPALKDRVSGAKN